MCLGKSHNVDGQVFVTGLWQRVEPLPFGRCLPPQALAGLDHRLGEVPGPRGYVLFKSGLLQGRGKFVLADYIEECPLKFLRC